MGREAAEAMGEGNGAAARGGAGPGAALGDAAALARAAAEAGPGRLPPVERWNPALCGEIDLRIARDGTWFHEGTPIGRPALVRLFSTILRRDGEEFFLVTPVEKLRIRVDDAPFVAVDFTAEGSGPEQRLSFLTNLGDRVEAGPEHPLRFAFRPPEGEPAPYVMVRRGLEALIDRKSFYRLMELGAEAEHEGRRWFGLWAGGRFFPILPAEELAG